ncbi:MAG: metal-dependent hydrolase [Methanobacteriaceae archaeon]|jgi:L-ascorbate metabolism protein UlaG (beta-lactamase superfamily)|nr:metal-dependent hydrolase [Methanobacteriaceae archaeon]MDO9626490.1 metal-dependent hydrolase [Methanobacteriaceae archaeon]
MDLRWMGHSAFELITEENLKILIDPFISNNPSCSVPVEEIEADLICITHGHADHFGDALEIANRTGALVIANHEISIFFSRQGFETQGMNIGGSSHFHNIKITMVDAIHSADIDFMEEITPGGKACGFIFELENGRKIYHAGDTSLFGDLKLVVGDFYKPDVALIPIGDRYTMGLKDASTAVKWISPKIVIPMHYNTFPVIEQDPEDFMDLVKNKIPNVEVIILNPGDIYTE